jgi:arylsulfatase A-like enzyme
LYDDLYFQYCQKMAAPRSETWDQLRRFPAADVLVDRACDWLCSLGNQPSFLWLHFMDPHAPYYPPAEALQAMGAADMAPARARYLNAVWNRGDLDTGRLRKCRDEIVFLHDAGIRWVDTQLARLIKALQTSSRWDSSVVVLTADHGEEFLDHGGRFHPPSRAYQEILCVPLLLRVPGAEKRSLSTAPFSHLHLAPTILHAVGIQAPEGFEGRSYWAEVQRGGGWELAVSESVGRCTNPMDVNKRVGARILAVQDQKHKLMVDFESNKEQMFDLESDPAELRPLPSEAEKRARGRLLRAALEHLDRSSRRSGELALRARVHEIRLEWIQSIKHSATPAS